VVVTRLRLRDFRTYASAQVDLGERLTVVHGPNGAGKTNLLEGLYFGCTGRSCRTSNEREVVRFDAPAARVEVEGRDRDGEHELSVGFQPGEAKRFRVDGAPAERLIDAPHRPLVSVFLPDRLELVKGPPALRRAHLDQLVAALWPARASTRRAYAQALAQRNALIARVRAGASSRSALVAWDQELARHGIALRDDRAAAVDLLRERFAAAAGELGLAGEVELRYRPRSKAASADELAAELAERVDSDLDRGFTTHGPHRDDVALLRDGRELRAYGSQGEQRLALLALLLAERAALQDERGAPPLLLLDDVMSELDADRRERLVERLRVGQSVVTTTDLAHVPGAEEDDVVRLRVEGGAVLAEPGRSPGVLERPEADRPFQAAGLDAPRR
jgi:DNA replication and repair protein RecF